MRVFSYWEGKQPDWIKLCLESLRRNVPGIEILTPSTWAEIWTEKDQQLRMWLDFEKPNVKSDYIRSWLLSHIGGIWVDADCIAFRDLRPIGDMLTDHDMVAYRVGQPAPQLCSALIASNAGGQIATQYHEIHRNKLKQAAGTKLHRLALGPISLAAAKRQASASFGFIPARLVHQIHWIARKQSQLDYDSAMHGDLVPTDAFCCMLTHRMLGPIRVHEADRIMAGPSVASEMFRRSFVDG